MSRKSNKKQVLKESRCKIFYNSPDTSQIIMHFKDSVSLEDDSAEISGKGVINNKINEYVMAKLNEANFQTHFIKALNMREQMVKYADPYNFKVVIRNVAAGSLVRRYDVTEGLMLNSPMLEYFFINKNAEKVLITDEQIISFGLADPFELEEIKSTAMRINDFLNGLFLGLNIRMIDIKLEFGRIIENEYYKTILIDEISPDTCRLWDLTTNEKLDKNSFIDNGKKAIKTYQNVAKRMGIIPN